MSSSDMIISFRGHAGPPSFSSSFRNIYVTTETEPRRRTDSTTIASEAHSEFVSEGKRTVTADHRRSVGPRNDPVADGPDCPSAAALALACLLCSPHPYYFLSTHSRRGAPPPVPRTRPPLHGARWSVGNHLESHLHGETARLCFYARVK